MTTPLVANSIRKFFVLTIALGTLAAGTLLVAPPADAKKNTCHAKYQGCSSRCARKYDNFLPCIQRTCERQYQNCVADGGNPDENAFAWIWHAPTERHARDSASLRAGDAD